MKDNNALVAVMSELAEDNGLPFPLTVPTPEILQTADCERAGLTPPEIMKCAYHGGDMVCAASFSGISADGRRLFLLNAALHEALKDDGGCVLYLAPGLSAREILRQWLSILSRVPLRRISGRCLSSPDWNSVCDAYFRLLYMNIRLLAPPSLDADAVAKLLAADEAERLLVGEPEMGFVVVDGINQMRENEAAEVQSASEKYESILYELKEIIMRRKLPLLCGLNMFPPLQPPPSSQWRPTLADLNRTVRDWDFEKVILIDGNTLAPLELYDVSVAKNGRGEYVKTTLFTDDTGYLADAPELEELFSDDDLPF